MMGGMRTPPIIVRGQGQDPEQAAGPVIEPTTGEKRAVAAIVLDHEQSEQKGAGRKDCNQPGPEAVGQRKAGRCPEDGERDESDEQFEGATPQAGLPVFSQRLQPRSSIVFNE